MANKMHVRKKDQVEVILGADRGKKGEVIAVDVKKGRVLVQGVRMITKHVKPSKSNPQGGRLVTEGYIASSNVMLHCTKCNKRTRITHELLEDGSKVRKCKHCKEIL